MNLASWLPTTLIDYPDHVAATLFVSGCNFRCPFCHNPELVLPDRVSQLPTVKEAEIFGELERRRGFLEGIVLTGGEPTLQPDLVSFVERLKATNVLVKLDTNGSRPEVVRTLLDGGLVDYIAVDIKAPRGRYEEYGGAAADPRDVERTIRIVVDKAPDYEFRTTVAPGLAASDIESIVAWIGTAKRYVLQAFRVPLEDSKTLLDPTWAKREALASPALGEAWAAVASSFRDGGVRA